MAYRAILEKPQEIRALVSSTNIVVADVRLAKTQVSVSQPTYVAAVTSRLVNALVAYTNPITEIHYQNLKAIDVVLDPYSLNKYFRLESVTMSDAPSVHVSKGFDEDVALSEQLTAQLNKNLADSVSIGDVIEVLLIIQRAFADSATVTDAPALTVTLPKTDTLSASDEATRSFDKGLTDAPTVQDVFSRTVSFDRDFSESLPIADSAALELSLARTDSTSLTDQFSKVVSYVRGFSDSSSLSDIASAAVTKGLADASVLSEAYAAALTKGLTDAFGLSESLTRSVSFVRSFTDSFTLDDFSNVNAIRKDTLAAKTNIISFSDVQTFSTEKALDDAATVSEQASLHVTRPLTDGFSTGDVFQKVVTFSRAPTDSLSVTEAQSAAFDKAVSDSPTLSDSFQATTSFERAFADAVSFAEQTTAAFEKGLSDTASLSESISITTSSTASAVLNASALNSVPLNN